jgi:hypothetical protein
MLKYFAGLIIGFVLGLTFPFGPACAAPLNAEQAVSIYAVAYGQYHGPREWLYEMPNIQMQTPQQLCAEENQKYPCGILGTYEHESRTITLADTLDFSTPYGASILLHEYVHHFQNLKEGNLLRAAFEAHDPATYCAVQLRWEYEAYAIQAHVLEKAGDYRSASLVRYSASLITCH